MRLYSRWQNSAGERVRIALNIKKIDYEYVPISELAPGEYQALNPQELMPTLEVDGQIIAQSAATLEYLEKVFPTPTLFPSDMTLRAQARAFAALISSEIHALTQKRIQRKVGLDGAQDWIQHWHSIGFGALEKTLEQRPHKAPFAFGEKPGWAEIHLMPQLANARRFDVDLAPYPLLLAIEKNCIKLDAFILALPENQIDFPNALPNNPASSPPN